MQGCGFRDLHSEFTAKGAEILGISYDTPADNKAFQEGQGFPYRLLSDSDKSIANTCSTTEFVQ